MKDPIHQKRSYWRRYTKAYGKAEVLNNPTDRPPREMTNDELFAPFNTTKAFTSAVTFMASQEGKAIKSPIDWNTAVASLILEDLILEKDDATKNCTPEDVLSHRLGMPEHTWSLVKQDATPVVRTMQYMPSRHRHAPNPLQPLYVRSCISSTVVTYR
ncbi:Peptidase S12, Pab87-related, C-terminal [Penicillium digitatum]|uniref:Peptidase S12, Pab87-related, C-terminal n=1 Tax=Penicillium digitatum TaxID=36651 RepID=A0A7T6XVL2_PENDI|nr:Peptidase S12, Pab87-related, C-terminal [Penicillium digitatum]